MLEERHLIRYADVLLWGLKTSKKSTLEKGDLVQIRFNLSAVRLAEILEAKLLEIGIHPVSRMSPTPVMEHNFFNISNDSQITFKTPGDEELYKHLNGSIFLHAPESITHLSNIDPKKISRFALSRKYLRDILNKREEAGLFGWTLCMLPTEELVKHASLSFEDYTNQVIKACFLDRKDPVKHWQDVYKKASTLKKWLNSMDIDFFHIESDSTDLKITLGKKRKWVGLSGHNIPSFELFLSPDWRGVNGIFYADQPSYRNGNYIDGVTLEFKEGVAIEAKAKTGNDFLQKQLSMDEGANKVGEFSLTDKRFSKINQFMANTLYDENFGGKYGNCHIAVGSSYSDAYDGDPVQLTKEVKKKLGFNDSALHWDLVNTEKKRVTAHFKSGKKQAIYEDGIFLY